jgi:hypothetical protein
MWMRLSLCLMLITMICPILVSAVSTTLTKMEQSDQKRSPTAFFRLYNIDPKNYLLIEGSTIFFPRLSHHQ